MFSEVISIIDSLMCYSGAKRCDLIVNQLKPRLLCSDVAKKSVPLPPSKNTNAEYTLELKLPAVDLKKNVKHILEVYLEARFPATAILLEERGGGG